MESLCCILKTEHCKSTLLQYKVVCFGGRKWFKGKHVNLIQLFCCLSGFWNDINCGYPNAFICQRHNSSINATAVPTTASVPGGCKEGWNFYNHKVLRKSSCGPGSDQYGE